MKEHSTHVAKYKISAYSHYHYYFQSVPPGLKRVTDLKFHLQPKIAVKLRPQKPGSDIKYSEAIKEVISGKMEMASG